MSVSLRQVAERAGVSYATVSRVLNGAEVRVNPETRKRIHSIASEMGYVPNQMARALVTGRSNTLAMWTSNLRSPYHIQLVDYAHTEVIKQGYELMIGCAHVGEEGRFRDEEVASWPVDGIMAFDIPKGVVPGMKNSLLRDKPFVAVGGYVPHNTDYVKLDFANQGREAVIHLHAIGCRRIAYLVPDWFEWFRSVDDERLLGYEAAIAEIGQHPEYITPPQELRRHVGATLREYVTQHGSPDGLFCYNDDMAIGALKTLRDLGLRVPQDVAIVGCDGIEDTEYHDPPITSVVQPMAEMCAMAWLFLRRRIAEPSIPLQQVTLAAHLEIRGSTVPAEQGR